jgi:hypothetical protein
MPYDDEVLTRIEKGVSELRNVITSLDQKVGSELGDVITSLSEKVQVLADHQQQLIQRVRWLEEARGLHHNRLRGE